MQKHKQKITACNFVLYCKTIYAALNSYKGIKEWILQVNTFSLCSMKSISIENQPMDGLISFWNEWGAFNRFDSYGRPGGSCRQVAESPEFRIYAVALLRANVASVFMLSANKFFTPIPGTNIMRINKDLEIFLIAGFLLFLISMLFPLAQFLILYLTNVILRTFTLFSVVSL